MLWLPPTGIKKKMAVSVAAQKVGEASPAAVDAGPPPEKTSERGEAPVATQKAGQRDDEKATASMATQRAGETSSVASDARPLPVGTREKRQPLWLPRGLGKNF